MCATTSIKDSKLLALDMVARGASEAEMVSAQPVFDSVPGDEAEQVWKAIVQASRG